MKEEEKIISLEWIEKFILKEIMQSRDCLPQSIYNSIVMLYDIFKEEVKLECNLFQHQNNEFVNFEKSDIQTVKKLVFYIINFHLNELYSHSFVFIIIYDFDLVVLVLAYANQPTSKPIMYRPFGMLIKHFFFWLKKIMQKNLYR